MDVHNTIHYFLIHNIKPAKKFGEFNVVSMKDYAISKETNMKNNEETELSLPTSNVLFYDF